MPVVSAAERLQKVLSQLGLGSRREAEAWIRAGRVTVNGKAAALGMRVAADDQLKLDGRPIRRQVTRDVPVFMCHRSPGEPLLAPRSGKSLNCTGSAWLRWAMRCDGSESLG